MSRPVGASGNSENGPRRSHGGGSIEKQRPTIRMSTERTQSMDTRGDHFRAMFANKNTECADPDKAPEIEGVLVKEGRGMLTSKWQKRYFALYGTRLMYWVEELDYRRGMPYKGAIDLAGCTIVSKKQTHSGRECCFGVFHPFRKDTWLGARDMPELVRWVQKLEEALGLRMGDDIYMTDFEMLSVVGRGASGMVYQVKKKDTGEVYAMKVISKTHMRNKLESEFKNWEQASANVPHQGEGDEKASVRQHWMVQSVKQERRILEVVNHPFIVRLFFAFQTPEKLCFVTDFVNGGELYSHISKAKIFNEDRARFYAGEIILALEYLHEMGIVYRDLKPENILLDREGHVKLTDFGQSKTNMHVDANNAGPDTSRRSFSLVGSPYYMAPEIFLKQGHGVEADWWSLGILIYEMLCGLPPFYSESTSKAYRRLLTDDIVYPPHVSEEARKLLRGLLNTDLALRFGSRDPPGPWNDDITRIGMKWSFAWFVPINWRHLLARKVKPPYTPAVSGLGDLSNISSQFTSEVIRPSPSDQEHPESQDPFASLFEDFTFNANTMDERDEDGQGAAFDSAGRSPALSPGMSPTRSPGLSPAAKLLDKMWGKKVPPMERLSLDGYTTGAAGGSIPEGQNEEPTTPVARH
eukprot:CAMPEP_0173398108 /NCGR_PEP_ID=MMETSP1356-20130122/40501_1 /TAXON_ID=77927 ORGANISM="Hemiselmis virescens, Strain PCC157" /NCGR_SAMPLE_ID=MMETSP1356 /ASSEMBLY_ACC=CAM_ASM_000847 /LENGTH=637 /DNA_ID=CAMNT_0014357533 /DNA_START=15 /DNA_END=1928 /DNA_ORIENTATION=+